MGKQIYLFIIKKYAYLFCLIFLILMFLLMVGCNRQENPLEVITTETYTKIKLTSSPTKTKLTYTSSTAITDSQLSPPNARPTLSAHEKYLIQLSSREFIPNEGLNSGFTWLNDQKLIKVHALLQLYEIPNDDEKLILEESGVTLLDYIPSLTWFATISKTLQEDSPVIELIRWFGPIFPEDKIFEALQKGEVGSWAIAENGNYILEVSFFADTEKEEMENILLSQKAMIIDHLATSSKFRIEIPQDQVISLAKEDRVRWIDIVPPPPTINSEGE